MPGSDAEWEATDRRVVELVRARDREEARRVLRAAISRAAADAPFWAGHFADMLGSLFLAEGRDREALDTYLEAERLDPTEPSRLLRIANCLLYFLNRPAEALQRVDRTLESVDSASWVYLDARGIRGVALLRLGRVEEATRVFEAIIASAERLPATSCDLRLVDELVERRQALSDCRRYLDLVLAKAESEGNRDVTDRGAAVVKKLASARNVS